MTSMIANPVLPPAADEDAPRLSVHTLGEFLFCPRAGLQAFENQGRDDDESVPIAHLDYLPPYELAELQERLQSEIQSILKLCLFLMAVGVIATLLIIFVSPLYAVAGAVSGCLCLTFMSRRAGRLWKLFWLHRQAERAGRQVLKDMLDGPERINWWALLNGGCDSVRYEKLFDQASLLGGRPWRVLRRGGLRIPVIRLRETKETLFDSHFSKIAAHCHLLHVCEPTTLSPYGIVLFGDTYTGFAIPNDAPSQAIFHRALVQMRAMIANAVRPDVEPPAPSEWDQRRLCAGCPWGFPVVYRPGFTESERLGDKLPARALQGKDERFYHSPCGDRFCWVPAHDKAVEKGLTFRR